MMRKAPLVFTEHEALQAASVLNSARAINESYVRHEGRILIIKN